MPFTKTYSDGTLSTDYGNSLAWQLISLRNEKYQWTVSGSGTDEYYVELAGGGAPGFIATPPTSNGVYTNSTARTKGTLGSLAANEWGYGNNDSLGFSTVYVRIGSDPDAQVADYVQFRQIPQAGENVRFHAGAGSVVTGLDQSAVAILGFYVENGYDGTMGSATGYLRIDPDVFSYDSRGQAWLDVGSANINYPIRGTGNAADGEFGLYLRGSNMAIVDVTSGSVGIAALPGETSTVATLRMSNRGTKVKCGAGVTLTSALPIFDGELWLHCGATTVTKYGGIVWLLEASSVSSVNDLGGGEFHWGSSGSITTYTKRGNGLFNMRASNIARTLTTLNKYLTSGTIIYNKEAVTITNDTRNDSYTETITG